MSVPQNIRTNAHRHTFEMCLHLTEALAFSFFKIIITGKVSQLCSNPRTKTTVTTVPSSRGFAEQLEERGG